jgi:(E)-4-hydroxy-3-methyl-but-2-enyl pyrophosphate reductase
LQIITAKTAGFCMGVKRAVEMALSAPMQYKKPIYTFGPLIHNPQVLELLNEKKIFIINDVPVHAEGSVMIRAHGIPPQVHDNLKRAGFTVIDATCPRVIKVQSIIKKYANLGYTSIIIGDKDHPEVIGLMGYAKKNGYVVSDFKSMQTLPEFRKAIIVAQTTQNACSFNKIKTWAQHHVPHYLCFNTICDSTIKRQEEVKQLSKAVESVIVIGGRNSGNTKRLAEIAGESGIPVYHIEKASELNIAALKTCKSVGITSGASTPDWVIKKVCKALES